MIDKITPRPSERIADDLEKAGVEYIFPKWASGIGERLWRIHDRPEYGQSVRTDESDGMLESGTFRYRSAGCGAGL